MSIPYKHSLLRGNNDIRLLELYPDSACSPIRGRLIHTSLQDAHAYEALSYAWGTDDKFHYLQLDSGFVAVTPSLHSALQLLRQKVSSRIIWADALYIDQDNNREKSHQVKLMSRIYQTAWRTIIFLGGGEDDHTGLSDKAFQLVHSIKEADFGDSPPLYITDAECTEKGLPQLKSPEWRVWNTMLELPWFCRLWVVQECVVAN
jgi:Heterokaryon incompatibility protein (HET)